ncbi:OLC1v1023164C1 [Oldenlandia corymbosa var. corymbosa]|uniref:OLC1v1023164C1 n=1 Tax=Oldenlandia corymbosa var. corymbosa TaxID=529605 RepID=A0AAV1BZN9_OLDCO|nr:OLC1v1023164C1 [Oldenlandia corymbosa var. corymbosa]
MAQLPPKVPSMPQNWPSSFPFQMMPLPSSTPPQNSSSWVDEFLDFSSARRSAHRRSASDSIAFVEAQFVEECRNSSNPRNNSSSCNNNGHGGGFEGLDDEQLRNMFSDDVAAAATGPSTLSSSNPSSTNPSTPSDQNSDNDEKNVANQDQNDINLQRKNETGDVDISSRLESPSNPSSNVVSPDAIVDPKRIKRILANRQSAQRSRVRKLQYISELERSVTTLQTEVSVLSPRVAFLDHQRLILNVDNSALKQRIAALAQDKIFKDGKKLFFLIHLHFL